MRELDSLLHSNRPLYTPICGPGILKRPSSRMLFVFRTIPLQAAFLPEVFCFLHVDPLPPQYLGLSIIRSFPEFFPRYYDLCRLLAVRCDYAFFPICLLYAPTRPPRVLTCSFPLYLPYLPQTIPCSFGASTYLGALPSLGALYAISVRQARGLPIRRPFNF